jgi:hypothetical protein
MKSLLLSTIVALALATTPALTAEKKGFVRIIYKEHRISIPIGIASQVCGHSASYIAKHRNTFSCTVSSNTQNKAFLNFINKSS